MTEIAPAIGILRGSENTFPDALVEAINEAEGDERAGFVRLDTIRMDGHPGHAVILDRISHRVPFYRSYLKWAMLRGAWVVNDPYWSSADDKFIENVVAARAQVRVPRTVLLPHQSHPPETAADTFRNLAYPLDWDAVRAYIPFPAYLKPYDGGGWRDVTRVTSWDAFMEAYHQSGSACMVLQEGIEYEAYFRCFCVGREQVRVMRYNPRVPIHERYRDVPGGPVDPDLQRRMERDARALCHTLGYDMNTVEFAVRDGVPYAIDFMNPAPDVDYHALGRRHFQWIVEATADFLVRLSQQQARTAPRLRRSAHPYPAVMGMVG